MHLITERELKHKKNAPISNQEGLAELLPNQISSGHVQLLNILKRYPKRKNAVPSSGRSAAHSDKCATGSGNGQGSEPVKT